MSPIWEILEFGTKVFSRIRSQIEQKMEVSKCEVLQGDTQLVRTAKRKGNGISGKNLIWAQINLITPISQEKLRFSDK